MVKDYAHDGDSDILTRTACISETGCYRLDANDCSASLDLLSCDTTIIKSGDKHTSKETCSFGHSENQMLQNTCDVYAICSTKLIPGAKQRNNFDRLFLKMRDTDKFENSSSYQHDALRWWLEGMKHFSESSTLIQRYLLAILYYHTDGVNWDNSINWLTRESECEWHGAECDDHSAVRKLNILLCNLAGLFVSEIGDLKGLESLVLSSNKLTGSLPKEIAKLEHLKILNLSSNELRGLIPSQINFTKNLKEIDLSSNVLTGTLPTEIGDLENIHFINLSNNAFSGKITDRLSNMHQLVVLNITNNLFQGNVDKLKGLKKLRKFNSK